MQPARRSNGCPLSDPETHRQGPHLPGPTARRRGKYCMRARNRPQHGPVRDQSMIQSPAMVAEHALEPALNAAAARDTAGSGRQELRTRETGMEPSRSSDTTTRTYTMGYSEEFQGLLQRRSTARNAAHLLPLLRPGMRVLDLGCGPGTISVGLAKAVEPGELIGIDIEESQIEMARMAARDGRHRNARFQAGDSASPALRRQLLRCRALPRRADARAGQHGRAG